MNCDQSHPVFFVDGVQQQHLGQLPNWHQRRRRLDGSISTLVAVVLLLFLLVFAALGFGGYSFWAICDAGRIEKHILHKTLRWEPRVGVAFTGGGVAYRVQDGALQVNQSGLYHVYSRVELIFKHCSPTSSFEHKVFVRSPTTSDKTLMEAHRIGFCSRRSEAKERHSWTADSYLASVLRLHQNDRVLVNVSHPQYISHSNHGNFFGLYKI